MLAADPVIAELQSSNGATLTDEDGDHSAWMEIHNAGDESVNLGGWLLTHASTDISEWTFPADFALEPGERRVVFASGKDRSSESDFVHTNFALNELGGQLQMIRPNRDVASDVSYPAMQLDESYGLATTVTQHELVAVDSAARAFVPIDDSHEATWSDLDFNDSEWLEGTLGVGFEQLKAGTVLTDSFTTDAWTVDRPDGSASIVEVSDSDVRIQVASEEVVTSTTRGLAPMVLRSLPNNVSSYEIVTTVRADSNRRGIAGLVVVDGATGLPVIQIEYFRQLLFRFGGPDGTFASKFASAATDYQLRLTRDAEQQTWTAAYRLPDSDWRVFDSVSDRDEEIPEIQQPSIGLLAANSMDAIFSDVSVQVLETAYQPRLGIDLESRAGRSPSTWVRIPFHLPVNPEVITGLTLRSSFDDGMAAYLNGNRIDLDDTNVPDDLAWNSAATANSGSRFGKIESRIDAIDGEIPQLASGDNMLAVQVLNSSIDDDDQFLQVELAAIESAPPDYFVLSSPTPGEDNAPASLPQPQINVESGVFFGETTVELSLPESPTDLQIRYSLDGSEPTENSPLYTEPLLITSSSLLRARTFAPIPQPDFIPSRISDRSLIAADPSLQDFSSNVPILVIDAAGRLESALSDRFTPAVAQLIDINPTSFRAHLGASANDIDYLGRIGVRDDGEDTAGQPKPELYLQTWGEAGASTADAESASLLGLAADSEWVVHAPFNFDRALMRNQLAYELSTQMQMWAPGYRVVEVYLDGGQQEGDGRIDADDYMGMYVLRERVAIGDGRLELADTTPDTPFDEGGFIWRVHRTRPEDPPFSAGGQSLNWVDPKGPRNRTVSEDERASQTQQDATRDYFDAFRDTLDSNVIDLNDPNGYSAFIDPVNWVDHHILSVFMMNVDALRLHGYFYKDAGERLRVGPVLDFDRSSESNDDRDDNPFMWRAETGDLGTDYFRTSTHRFWGELFRDPNFWQLYVDRWSHWRSTVLSDFNVQRVIDGMAGELGEAAGRNFERWRHVRPRASSQYIDNQLDGTFQGEVNNIKQWLSDRGTFMNSNFAVPPRVSFDGVDLDDRVGIDVEVGSTVTISATPLPRNVDRVLISGEIGATRARFIGIGDDALGDRWTAPGFDDSDWLEGAMGLGYKDVAADDRDGFRDLIETEFRPTDEFPGSTTTLVRIDFAIDDLEAASQRELVFRAMFDDGYVLYLNGERIGERNLRDPTLRWDSRARSHRNSEAVQFDELDITEFRDRLVAGENTLAIRLINANASSADLLLVPELVSREQVLMVPPEARVYFTLDGSDPRGPDGEPSPGAVEIVDPLDLPIDSSVVLTARTLDPSGRGSESEVVRTDWSAPLVYSIRTGTAVDGDITGDGVLDASDIDRLLLALAMADQDGRFDMNGDGSVDTLDRDAWVSEKFGTTYGDANLDGVFDSSDLVQIFQVGEFQDTIAGNSTWSEGDWTGDGDFTTADLVLAFQTGGFRPV